MKILYLMSSILNTQMQRGSYKLLNLNLAPINRFQFYFHMLFIVILCFSEFVEKSLENYKEFEKQKDLDLMKILKDYASFQTKYAQKVCTQSSLKRIYNNKYYKILYIYI